MLLKKKMIRVFNNKLVGVSEIHRTLMKQLFSNSYNYSKSKHLYIYNNNVFKF